MLECILEGGEYTAYILCGTQFSTVVKSIHFELSAQVQILALLLPDYILGQVF